MINKDKFKELFYNYELTEEKDAKARITIGLHNTLILVDNRHMIHGALPRSHEYSLPYLYGQGQSKFGPVWIDPEIFKE